MEGTCCLSFGNCFWFLLEGEHWELAGSVELWACLGTAYRPAGELGRTAQVRGEPTGCLTHWHQVLGRQGSVSPIVGSENPFPIRTRSWAGWESLGLVMEPGDTLPVGARVRVGKGSLGSLM